MSDIRFEESAMAVVFCNNLLLTTIELIYGKEILSLPKGHTEEGETALDAAIRECYEETNIVIGASDLVRELKPYSYEFMNPSGAVIRKRIVPYLFEVAHFGELIPKEKRMLSVQWMQLEEFLKLCPYENVINIVREVRSL